MVIKYIHQFKQFIRNLFIMLEKNGYDAYFISYSLAPDSVTVLIKSVNDSSPKKKLASGKIQLNKKN